jgi:Family of unknown function (DUF6158)
MTRHPDGIPAAQLTDADLSREIAHLHATRHDTFLRGTADALRAHTDRMIELEVEFKRRFEAVATPDPLRTRAGSRAAAGQ